MKNYLSFLFIFFFALGFGQIPRDTIREIQREKKRERNQLEKCEFLIKDFENISFKKLEKKIVENIIFNNTKKNVVIDYELPFWGKESYVLMDPFDYNKVYCNYNNPVYNQSDFWNIKTIKYLQKKFNINLIPHLPIKNIFINSKTIKFNVNKEDKAIKLFSKSQMTEIDGHFNVNNGEKYYYFPYKNNKNKIDLSEQNSQKIEIKFRNYLGKIVSVQYKYDEYNSIYKTYQYLNKKWVEIPTIEEYKF